MEVGWAGSAPHFIYMHHTSLTAPGHLLFPSLPGPVVGEMLSAARFAAVGMVGRPLTHIVRDAFCEGDEGIAEVREQHGYPPTASAVRECSGNVVGVHAVSLEIMQIVTSTIRTNYLPWVQCKRDTAQGSAASWRPCNVVWPHQGPVPHS